MTSNNGSVFLIKSPLKNFILPIGLPLLSFVLSASAFGKVLTIAADTWCPYNCDASSRERGFMIDVVSEVLSKHGYSVSYRNESWTKALQEVQDGAVDAVVGAGSTESEKLVVAKEPLGVNKTCFYTLAGSGWKYTGVGSLSDVRLGVIAGYLYGGETDLYVDKTRTNYEKLQLVTGDKPLLQNVKKLQAGRIDALVENEMVMTFSSHKFALLGLRNAGCDKEMPLYIAFSPKHAESKRLAEYVNQGIPELRRSGKLKAILARYGVKDWK